jgi:hypothetical protein
MRFEIVESRRRDRKELKIFGNRGGVVSIPLRSGMQTEGLSSFCPSSDST